MAKREVDLKRLGPAFKRLVLWFGAQLAIFILGIPVLVALEGSVLGALFALVRFLALLCVLAVLVYYAYQTSAALGSRVGVLWALAMVIPLVNLVALLALNSNASKACREAGMKVGFLGPKLSPPAVPGRLNETAG